MQTKPNDVDSAYDKISSRLFVFHLHLLKGVLEVTNDLHQVLQFNSQYILNA